MSRFQIENPVGRGAPWTVVQDELGTRVLNPNDQVRMIVSEDDEGNLRAEASRTTREVSEELMQQITELVVEPSFEPINEAA